MWHWKQNRVPAMFYVIVCGLSILAIIAMVWQYAQMNSRTRARTPTQNLPNSRSASSSSNWIVMTSSHHSNELIKRLSQSVGWNLIIVTDMKMSNYWRKFNVTILDKTAQHKLGYRVLKYLPSNSYSYTRKIIGYLYAIQHGARFIYDYDMEDNVWEDPLAFQKDFVFERVTRGLILNKYNDNPVANPYIHFGQHSLWPRGFPLDYIEQNHNHTYTVCRMATPLIQQGIMNGDLDPDAIRRLTRKPLNKTSPIQFDSAAPPVIFPKGVLAPFNSKSTLFHYDAFWALALPISAEYPETDIWRGYWAQPLLWAIGRNLGFYSTNATQTSHNNTDSYHRNFGEKDGFYKYTAALVKFLAGWRCSSHDLYKCMLELTSNLVYEGVWSFVEIEFMEAWIHDLKSIGYKPPPIRRQHHKNFSPCLNETEKTFAVFHPVETQPNVVNSRVPLRQFCNFTAPKIPSNRNRVSHPNRVQPLKFPSTLLVITFNNPYYDVIWLLDIIYRPHYPNILYCGDLENVNGINDFAAKKSFSAANVKKFSFVHANVGNSFYVYECALRAIDMNYNVDGYIVVSDDVLFNFWNNGQLNPAEPWLFNNFMTLSIALPVSQTAWVHWSQSYGYYAIANALYEIYNRAYDENIHVKQFVRNREIYGYNSTIAMVSAVDIYYFPASKQYMFYEVGSILRKHKVYLEISIPVILSGISAPLDIDYMTGTSLWANNRDIPFDFFNASHNVLHPVKPSHVIKDLNFTRQYCQHYVARILQL